MSGLEERLDRLVREAVEDQCGPGCVVGIASGGDIATAWRGRANLEHRVPIEVDTVFHVASLSKQFTAYAAQLLIERGSLALDDPVAAHLDWMPRDDITVEHLLRHTSGLRDQWQLIEASGRRIEDVITTDEIVDLVRRQRGLNFAPGTRFSYSNTNYTVLGLLVESCSGRSLQDFCADAIFGPLGMDRTRFVADHHEVVPDRADSYEPADGNGYRRLTLSYSTVGATGLNSTVSDMLGWLACASTRQVRRLRELRAPLPEPGPESYGAGVRLGRRGAHRLVYHAGADAGYRCHFLALPGIGAAAVLMSNLRTLSTERLCRHALELAVLEPVSRGQPTRTAQQPARAAELSGSYVDRDGDLIQLYSRGSTVEVVSHGRVTVLEPDGPARFGVVAEGRPVVEVGMDGSVLYTEEPASAPQPLLPVDVSDPTAPCHDQTRLTGVYFSDEVDARVRIIEDGGQLWLHRSRWSPTMLRRIGATAYVAGTPSVSETPLVRLDFEDGCDSMYYSTPLARRIHFRRWPMR